MKRTFESVLQAAAKENSILFALQMFESCDIHEVNSQEEAVKDISKEIDNGYPWKPFTLQGSVIKSSRLNIYFADATLAKGVFDMLLEWQKSKIKKPCSCGKIHTNDSGTESGSGSDSDSDSD